ncbi:GNAT family N-acetyltransferase [Agromyces aurantiacus]|uniref:GNAT family N-acetyltransferase n=1 Tax=Agromyces aurantiacus TaxID=165814 RepID=A0ABV9R5F8_9MICO|nr:GNAT family N-acetyltransferase [Agromyces aurantiacus]MBM7503638.1 GNAT superfamily N-acetyltransferase [Agromyces aurantiacus]
MTSDPLPISDTLHASGDAFTLRRARPDDVEALVRLIAADSLRAAEFGFTDADLASYARAFQAIDADPAQLLVIVERDGGEPAGTMQLTFIPGLSRGGATRLQIEAVRVADDLRGRGVGSAMIRWALDHARERGARLVQLTSDARRDDAHRFYERLGFEASHVGFKLYV